jgi:hypothetical protein
LSKSTGHVKPGSQFLRHDLGESVPIAGRPAENGNARSVQAVSKFVISMRESRQKGNEINDR